MSLTGLQIQKLLPKTNCKECGSSTCLAFAMKLAAKKAALSQCPYASEEAKRVLGAASEPPIRKLQIGADPRLSIGEETVLYRHEKSFVHRTLLAINIDDTMDARQLFPLIERIAAYAFVRVGQSFVIDLIAITNREKNPDDFAAWAKMIREKSGKPLIVRSDNEQALLKAAALLRGCPSVFSCARPDTVESLSNAMKEYGHILAVSADTMDGIAAMIERCGKSGFFDILIQSDTDSIVEQFRINTAIRRMALVRKCKSLGFPILRFIDRSDVAASTLAAVTEIGKYGGVCVLPSFDPAQVSTLMTLRQNIYTDPQKPIQVEPKLYPIGEPGPTSPVFVTTNFSLTYFIVSGEIENSGISAWLLVPECEGMSVLTAWAAGKFSGAVIAAFMKEIRVEAQIKTREVIIPGYVACISGELEDQLPGWKVVVGPAEAGDIESFVKAKGYA